MSLSVQFVSLWSMFACGLLMGFVFDVYRVLSGTFNFPRRLVHALDIVLWIIASLLVFRVLYWSNHGQLRLFVFIGLIAGAVCYFTLITATATRLIRWVIRFLKRVIRIVLRIFNVLIVAPIKLCYRLISAIFGILFVIAMFLFRFVIQLLYPLRKSLPYINRGAKSVWRQCKRLFTRRKP